MRINAERPVDFREVAGEAVALLPVYVNHHLVRLDDPLDGRPYIVGQPAGAGLVVAVGNELLPSVICFTT